MESSGWSHDVAAAPSFEMLISGTRDESVATSTPTDQATNTIPTPAELLGERVTSLHPSLAAQLLTTIESQTAALSMVLAAHDRGAITLPASLLAFVTAAHARIPSFLGSSPLT